VQVDRLKQFTFYNAFDSGRCARKPSRRVAAQMRRGAHLRSCSGAHGAAARRAIVRQNGPLALWRGNGAMMIRVVPYSAITFMTFRPYEKVRARTHERACALA
jgi:hypothetical protein